MLRAVRRHRRRELYGAVVPMMMEMRGLKIVAAFGCVRHHRASSWTCDDLGHFEAIRLVRGLAFVLFARPIDCLIDRTDMGD